MTRDEILALPAGRELDALTAEKVMGKALTGAPALTHPSKETEDTPWWAKVPAYSTNLMDVWIIWLKMQDAQTWSVFVEELVLLARPGPKGIGNDDELMWILRSIKPLAICRAALLTTLNE